MLASSSLLLLFTIAALGYLAGKVRIFGVGLGVAAVLFVGLLFGAIDERLKLPEFVQTFGLVLFVYTIGLGSGPGFFASLRRRGLAINGAAVGVLVFGAGLVAVLARVLHIGAATAAGLFAGSLTNTPALAAVVESGSDKAAPVVAYSIAYPFGVLGVLGAVVLAGRRKGGPAAKARAADAAEAADGEGSTLSTLTVVARALEGRTLASVSTERDLHVVFARLQHAGTTRVPTADAVLHDGDLVTVVGAEKDVSAAADALGERSSEHLELDRNTLDFRRLFVSNAEVIGVPLRELRLPEKLGAVVTRVRRGDVDLLGNGDLVLELGDRVRVVAPRERMTQITRLFGDSYRALSEVDVITFGLGIMLGLLLGSVRVPLPGGQMFSLGVAGGPLVAGLVLGRLGRTGPLVWSMPFSANLTLRQLGLVLFLAAVGSRSGNAFTTMLATGDGPLLLAAGAAVTASVAGLALVVGRRVLDLPTDMILGFLSGIHTQPAALAFAVDRAGSDRPNVGYATVYPLVTITKIVLAQALFALLR